MQIYILLSSVVVMISHILHYTCHMLNNKYIFTTYAYECCSLLKSHTFFVEFLLTTWTAIFKVVLVSFNFLFFLHIFIYNCSLNFYITVKIRSNNQDEAVTLPCISTQHAYTSHLKLPSEFHNCSCQAQQ